MIKLINDDNSYPITHYTNCYTVHSDGGDWQLNFDVSPKDEQYKGIAEEVILEYGQRYYNVKKINERAKTSTIQANLNLDDFLADSYFSYHHESNTLSNTLDDVLSNTGWTHVNAGLVAHSRTIDLEKCNKLDILNKICELWNCKFEYDNKNKVITVIDISAITPSGVFLMEDLNLQPSEFKGDSTDFCTKLICRGARRDDGTFVTIESVNDGKDYIENHDYSDKVITRVWTDERYTVPQNLKDDAIELLKTMAIPARSYTCKPVNVKVNLYDVITLVDKRRKTRINHSVTSIKTYEDSTINNTISLTSAPTTITGNIKRIESTVQNPGEISVDGVTINEMKRDINSNSLQIQQRYTRGETDTIIDSKITQNSDVIRSEVKETYVNKNDYNTKIASIEQSIDNVEIRFSKSGYRNLLNNSCGINGLDSWITSGNIGVINVNSDSGSGFNIIATPSNPAYISQSVILDSTRDYTINCKVIPNISTGTKIKFTLINGENTEQTNILYESNVITSDEFTQVYFTFHPLYNNCVLKIEDSLANTTGFIITDLILSCGTNPLIWTQSDAELFTSNTKISDGCIDIGSSTTSMHSRITTSSFEIYRGNEKRINVAPEGTKLQKTIIEDDLTVGIVKEIVRDSGVDFVVIGG